MFKNGVKCTRQCHKQKIKNKWVLIYYIIMILLEGREVDGFVCIPLAFQLISVRSKLLLIVTTRSLAWSFEYYLPSRKCLGNLDQG